MSISLKITSLLFILIVWLLIFELVKKEKISIKYSLVWFIPLFILFIFIIVPGVLMSITKLFGFQTGSNLIISLLMALLMIISIALTAIVSKQKNQIKLLIQELSMLKEDLNEKK